MAKKSEKTSKSAPVALENYDGAWASNPAPETRKTLEIAGVEWAFRYCPSGTFGGGDVKKGANPFKITLTRGFWIAKRRRRRNLASTLKSAGTFLINKALRQKSKSRVRRRRSSNRRAQPFENFENRRV